MKYWGKSDAGRNLAATSSLAVTVNGLHTDVRLQGNAGRDYLCVDGTVVPEHRYTRFFDAARATTRYRADASNSFPVPRVWLARRRCSRRWRWAPQCWIARRSLANGSRLLARIGSASTARALWGGLQHARGGSRMRR